MAQLQLKRPDEARKTLAEAADLAKTKLPKLESGDLGEDWPEWLIAHITESLGRRPAVLCPRVREQAARCSKTDSIDDPF